MKLMTKALEKKFAQFPLGSQDGCGDEAVIIAKFFDPSGPATWLITEGEQMENGDWDFFGCVDLGYGWEWGYVWLSQIQEVKGAFGLGMERDLYLPANITVGEYMRREGNA